MKHKNILSNSFHILPILFFLLSAFFAIQVKAQSANDIVRVWLNQEKEGRIEIYRQNEKYYGKIIWLKEPNENGKPKLDKHNPEDNKRTQPILGLIFLKDFAFNAGKWDFGKIYDPRDGKTYNCNITLIDKNKLKVRGFIGYAWMGLGKTNVWTRVTN